MRRLISVIAALCFVASARTLNAVPTPLAEYLFEETGVTAVNTGSLGTSANLTMGTSQADPTDRHSPLGDGVSYVSPRAQDHRFGDTSVWAHAVSSGAGSLSALDNLGAVTITGWYLSERADRYVGNERQMVANGGSPGFRVEGGERSGGVQDTLRFMANGAAVVSGAGTYPDPGSAKYTYFAITFDGSSGDVKFYRGYTDTLSSLVSTQNIGVTNTGDNGELLAVGGRASVNAPRTFHGLLDDVRIFGSALSASDIESVRLSSLPEPASAAVLALLAGCWLIRRRREF